MKTIRIITAALLLSSVNESQAQQPVNYNLHTQNPFLLNSAYMGQNECINAFVNRQNRWTDLHDAPTVNTFAGYSRFGEKTSLGAMIVSDNRSLVNYLTANLLYGYHTRFAKEQHLTLSLSAGVANNSLNTDRVVLKDKTDPLFQSFNSTRIDAGFGALYTIKNAKVGMSVPHFFDQTGDFSNQFNVQASYDHFIGNREWRITPVATARNYNVVGMLFDAHLVASWKETMTAQAGYRTDQSIIAGLGVMWKSVTVSYAYQYNTGSTYNAFSSSGTQEIQLAVRICKKKESAPVIVPVEKAKAGADKVTVMVNMTDEKYGSAVNGNVVVKQGMSTVYSGNVNGQGQVMLDPGLYTLEVSAKGYVPIEDQVDLASSAKGTSFTYQLKPTKLEKGVVFKLKTVNFETGADQLKASSYQILNKIVDMLKENPQMVLEVAGYTDNTGDDEINLKLSEKRANAVVAYLSSKGALPAQMKAVGYGEANPIADNNTEEGRLANRRVMFSVLEY